MKKTEEPVSRLSKEKMTDFTYVFQTTAPHKGNSLHSESGRQYLLKDTKFSNLNSNFGNCFLFMSICQYFNISGLIVQLPD